MEKIIYAEQANSITPQIKPLENLIWEINSDDHLITEITKDGIIITPDKNALLKPHRILQYTIEETGKSEQFELVIKKKERKKEPGIRVQSEQQTDSSIPETLKISSNKTILVPGTLELLNNVSWFFSNDNFNHHLKLSAEGVKIDHLPPGMYTLCCQFHDQDCKEIIIQSMDDRKNKKAQPRKSDTVKFTTNTKDTKDKNTKSSKTEEQTDTRTHDKHDDDKKNEIKQPESQKAAWPEIVEKCAIEIKTAGHAEKFPIQKTSSLLIGKQSRSQKVVDIDLGSFTQNTRKISRNHLKIWFDNQQHLMMKNIGSHRVLYRNKEVFPNQIAVLKIGGQIQIEDITLTINRI